MSFRRKLVSRLPPPAHPNKAPFCDETRLAQRRQPRSRTSRNRTRRIGEQRTSVLEKRLVQLSPISGPINAFNYALDDRSGSEESHWRLALGIRRVGSATVCDCAPSPTVSMNAPIMNGTVPWPTTESAVNLIFGIIFGLDFSIAAGSGAGLVEARRLWTGS